MCRHDELRRLGRAEFEAATLVPRNGQRVQHMHGLGPDLVCGLCPRCTTIIAIEIEIGEANAAD